MNRFILASMLLVAVALVAVEAAPKSVGHQIRKRETDLHDQLQDKAELLLKLLQELSRKLRNAERKVEAEFFEKIEEGVLDIDNKLREWHPTDPLGKWILKGLEWGLHEAEVAIEKKLKEIGDIPDN